MLVDCLTLWQDLHVNDSSRIEECDQHELDFGLRLSCFLWPQRQRTLPLKALALGLRVILKDPRLITSDDSLQQVWLSLEMLENVLTHLHAPLLVIVQNLWHHLRTDLHTQIFRDNLPHAVTVDFQLICYHSNSQPMIAMHHLLHALNIVHSPACSTPRVVFHIFASFLEPLVPLKDTSVKLSHLHTLPAAF